MCVQESERVCVRYEVCVCVCVYLCMQVWVNVIEQTKLSTTLNRESKVPTE